MAEPVTLLRNHGGGHAPVSYIELFLDLVFVFAVTQLSHFLLSHLNAAGALQTAILFLAVWWAWIYTTWATNWLEPEHGGVRLVIAGVMLGSLVLSSALPLAFSAGTSRFVNGGMAFALAYCTIQLVRSLFVAWAMREDRTSALNLWRISIWFAASVPLWIGGGLAEDETTRMAWWAAALAVDYAGPFFRFRVPFLGYTDTRDWVISGSHMAERCGLFIIIALGEGIIVTGTEFSRHTPTVEASLALLTAFAGSFAMWWVYFDLGAQRAADHIDHHEDAGRIGRNVYTYTHLPIVAGIVVLAVADEMTLAHPGAPSHGDFLAVVMIGAALFLGGTMVFKRQTSGNPWFPVSHIAGLWLLAALGLAGWLFHPAHLWMMLGVVVVFGTVALWEWVSFHGGWIDPIEQRWGRLGRYLRHRAELRQNRLKEPEEPPAEMAGVEPSG